MESVGFVILFFYWCLGQQELSLLKINIGLIIGFGLIADQSLRKTVTLLIFAQGKIPLRWKKKNGCLINCFDASLFPSQLNYCYYEILKWVTSEMKGERQRILRVYNFRKIDRLQKL